MHWTARQNVPRVSAQLTILERNTALDWLQAGLHRRNVARRMNVNVNKADQEVVEHRDGLVVAA